MKNKTLLSASLALMMALPMQAQKFEDNFEDKTLRLDYIVAGDSVNQAIRTVISPRARFIASMMP